MLVSWMVLWAATSIVHDPPAVTHECAPHFAVDSVRVSTLLTHVVADRRLLAVVHHRAYRLRPRRSASASLVAVTAARRCREQPRACSHFVRQYRRLAWPVERSIRCPRGRTDPRHHLGSEAGCTRSDRDVGHVRGARHRQARCRFTRLPGHPPAPRHIDRKAWRRRRFTVDPPHGRSAPGRSAPYTGRSAPLE